MFGTNSQNRGGMLRPFQELEQITSSLLGRPKLDFTLDVKDQGEAYVLEAGAEKEDLSVTLEGKLSHHLCPAQRPVGGRMHPAAISAGSGTTAV